MKRSPLNRKTPLGRSRAGVRPINSERKAKAYARNFGDEADAVRDMRCLLGSRCECFGPIAPAHVVSRGASGGRFDIVPLCTRHHDEQHAVGIKTFEARYGLDLRAEADHIALEHVDGLGIRGLAIRWVPVVERQCGECSAPASCCGADGEPMCGEHGEPLEPIELDALLGWVRRWLARDSADAAAHRVVWSRELAAHDLSLRLGVLPTYTLCESAGWPS